MKIELPYPPSGLNPNRKNGKHWSATNAIKAGYTHDCWALTLAAMGTKPYLPPAGDMALYLTFVLPTKRRPDADNLLASAKAALDGMAAALKVNDACFEPITVRRVFGNKPGALIVEIGQ